MNRNQRRLLLLEMRGDNPLFAVRHPFRVSRQELLKDIVTLARRLPNHRYAINLCEDRYTFSVSFLAVILRGQINLLPSSRQYNTLLETATGYPDHYFLGESRVLPDLQPQHAIELNASQEITSSLLEVPTINPDQPACIAFTSGSTGKTQPNNKTWGQLVISSKLALRRFGLTKKPQHSIVATVPPQHMYGLECTVLYPLFSETAVNAGRPFYPEDIRAALALTTAPRVLVTTPVHLQACVEANLPWPDIAFIISATAPLSRSLARRVENVMRTQLFEIYGFTEAGAIASRRTTAGATWQLYDRMELLQTKEDALQVKGPHLAEPVPLQDVVEWVSTTEFKLHGRPSDLINIAGKRTSCNDLNLKLNSISGVMDGVFIPPKINGHTISRLSALVVAPKLETYEILRALAKLIDPVFLPRPLRKVDRLPRNDTGKLPRDDLIKYYKQINNVS